MPPRVPKGVPSTCRICEPVRGTFMVASDAPAFGSPTASVLMRLAARKYPSINVAEKLCASATLSNPSLIVSAGRKAATSTSTESRSLTACAYSARFSR